MQFCKRGVCKCWELRFSYQPPHWRYAASVVKNDTILSENISFHDVRVLKAGVRLVILYAGQTLVMSFTLTATSSSAGLTNIMCMAHFKQNLPLTIHSHTYFFFWDKVPWRSTGRDPTSPLCVALDTNPNKH